MDTEILTALRTVAGTQDGLVTIGHVLSLPAGRGQVDTERRSGR